MIEIDRWWLIALGAIFSAYHVVLGIVSLDVATSPWPAVAALVLYSVATVLSLWPGERIRLAGWIAGFDLAVAVALPLLVTGQLRPEAENGYATWYVAAVGTLMTIAAARRRIAVAWVGVLLMAALTTFWAGIGSLGTLGVFGSIVWVGVAHLLTWSLAHAARETRRFAHAEREAAAWQAAQDAHLFEGRFRIAQTARLAVPMLRRIIAADGRLSEDEKAECRRLEAAIRDEIRGRMLLTDAVRVEVQRARARGATVALLDEGGLDEVDELTRERILAELASAIGGTDADRIIVRTTADGTAALTVVGLKRRDDVAGDAVADEDDDEVALWLEIPR
ncbi:hypothetical protein [Agromyces seonyuensis]|uniref:Uncharacterized protein n=1 Tax=Agromyces seonyuensis TaxID=2662446 RepID=A0A6I4NZW9_9MICO|nr:hypothetical protein [Agromyces seonyuensis]MWB99868.1 hypothetical protein [Agromyces seonyuensis]